MRSFKGHFLPRTGRRLRAESAKHASRAMTACPSRALPCSMPGADDCLDLHDPMIMSDICTLSNSVLVRDSSQKVKG